jgi:uroporphyrinogen-III decarboxylase
VSQIIIRRRRIKHKHSPVLPVFYSVLCISNYFCNNYQERVDSITKLDPAKSVPFTGEVLRRLKKEIGNKATLLGFVGLPFTLATYLIEGKSSQE